MTEPARNRKTGRNAAHKAAFTLVELLVVIVIIGLLAAMLLTSLAGAKGHSVRAKCLNHERQLFLGIRVFADENNDLLPPRELPWWVAQLQPYYLKGGVLICPSDPSRLGVDTETVATNDLNASSYILNVFNYYAANGVTVIDEDGTVRVAGGAAVDLRRISAPSTAILLAEKVDYSTSNNSFYMDYAGNDQMNKVYYRRHDGGSNYTFADGHQEFIRVEAVMSPHNLWTATASD